jgi:hypothetical protein
MGIGQKHGVRQERQEISGTRMQVWEDPKFILLGAILSVARCGCILRRLWLGRRLISPPNEFARRAALHAVLPRLLPATTDQLSSQAFWNHMERVTQADIQAIEQALERTRN